MRLNEVFGNNIKYFRYRKKYTQEKVAELTNMSVTYISQLELGHHTPSFERLEALSKALGVEPFEFYVRRDIKKLPARVDMAENKWLHWITKTIFVILFNYSIAKRELKQFLFLIQDKNKYIVIFMWKLI